MMQLQLQKVLTFPEGHYFSVTAFYSKDKETVTVMQMNSKDP